MHSQWHFDDRDQETLARIRAVAGPPAARESPRAAHQWPLPGSPWKLGGFVDTVLLVGIGYQAICWYLCCMYFITIYDICLYEGVCKNCAVLVYWQIKCWMSERFLEKNWEMFLAWFDCCWQEFTPLHFIHDLALLMQVSSMCAKTGTKR